MWFSIALQVAFGSLYRDDVLINPSRVIALLAAASMLQLVSGNGSLLLQIFAWQSTWLSVPSSKVSKVRIQIVGDNMLT